MKWFIATMCVFGLAWALQSGLVAFAGYVVMGVLLLSRYLARAWVHQLVGERLTILDDCTVGTEVEVKVRIRNQGTLPVGWVLAEDLLSEKALKQRPPAIRLSGKRIRIGAIRSQKSMTVKYKITFVTRGYYQIGPLVLETGDLFGLHRRHRVIGDPQFVLVYPKVVPLPQYNFASERPIGEVQLAHRLFEDPTRTSGVRPYQLGDPLQRIHWRATARTGMLHSRVYEPTTLAGATILVDFHQDHYHARGEPYRSELVVTVAASLAYAVSVLNQQLGLATNALDAAERIRIVTRKRTVDEGDGYETRDEMREEVAAQQRNDRLRPLQVTTRRSSEQFHHVRQMLARIELTDRSSFAEMVLEVATRVPRDATILAILPAVPIETSVALGSLRRRGFAISVILVAMEDEAFAVGYGRLVAEGVRDVRRVQSEADLALLGEQQAALNVPNPYQMHRDLA